MAADEEQEAPLPLVTHVNIILHSLFSNIEVNINNQRTYISNGFYAHKSYISDNLKGAISEYKGVVREYDSEEFPYEIMGAPLSEPFFTKGIKF